MPSSSPDLPQKSLQIKQDNKFFTRLLSKENSMTNSSFRVYYGGAKGEVPFMWESQPGTPKHTFSDTSLPPLTPPPSYHFSPKKRPTKNPSKSNLLHFIFPRLSSKKTTHVSPSALSSSSLSSSSSYSSSLSSSSTPTIPSNFDQRRRRFASPRSSFDSRGDYEEEGGSVSPTSTSSPCFSVHRQSAGGLRGCSSIW
ncbi:PREDICTED: putative protein TPRXL [Nelumbo nucifera]|uniref:Uncharacterized protein n=2 Tax=Nelumbo nucifera TaxID=4432 RepID=A0A1U8APC0_NELNU|nr:PREDICTED: putative protein TPRXL [Nelumbo nucifera]DAD28186.1 TPA_asm: hypothetical protein HUJ06_029654 [Nelumbo nucifera]